MLLLQTEPSEDGHLRRQQVWSGRSRKAGELETSELEGDQPQTRNVVRTVAAESASMLANKVSTTSRPCWQPVCALLVTLLTLLATAVAG